MILPLFNPAQVAFTFANPRVFYSMKTQFFPLKVQKRCEKKCIFPELSLFSKIWSGRVDCIFDKPVGKPSPTTKDFCLKFDHENKFC